LPHVGQAQFRYTIAIVDVSEWAIRITGESGVSRSQAGRGAGRSNMKPIRLLSAMWVVLAAAAVVKAGDADGLTKKYTCEVRACAPVQPDGGTHAQKLCDYTKKTPQVFILKSYGPQYLDTSTAFADAYKVERMDFGDYKFGINADKDKNGGIILRWFENRLYLLPGKQSGLMFLKGDDLTLSYALLEVDCVVE